MRREGEKREIRYRLDDTWRGREGGREGGRGAGMRGGVASYPL
jgi:hypothetical protein